MPESQRQSKLSNKSSCDGRRFGYPRPSSYSNWSDVKYASMVDCPQDYVISVRIVILEAHLFFNQSFLCYVQGCGSFVCVFI